MKTNLFKTLSLHDLLSFGFKCKREYFYQLNDGKYIKLDETKFKNTNNDSLYQLVDPFEQWDPKNKGIFMSFEINFRDSTGLFGRSNYVFEDAKVGVGITWQSEGSKYRHCIKFGDITHYNKDITFKKTNVYIENFSSNTTFSIILYISKPGNCGGNAYFANEKGMVLCEEPLWTVILDGEGSIFPIFDYEDPNGPLWSYDVDVDDITEEPFDRQHISIKLNKLHNSYRFLNYNDESFNESFFKEIIASAMTMIIIKLRENEIDGTFDFKKSYEKGSILSVLKFFNDVLSIKVNSTYEEILDSFHIFIDKGVL